MKSLCALFLVVLFFLAESEANRLTEARVPIQHARGPSATNGQFLCFSDNENGFQICVQESTAPQFREGEPGYGTQNYVGYITRLDDPLTRRGFVYGHSLTGRTNMYLWFQYQSNFYSYSFDYCPEIWKTPATAYFSVYHVLVGSLMTGSIVDLISKLPFTQENLNIGVPGGAQVACSTERFPIPVQPQPIPPPPDTDAKPPSPGGLRSEILVARGPEVSGTPEQGWCFYEDYHPQEKWWFSGGTGSLKYEKGSSSHQSYYGKVQNINTGVVTYAFGHSPRGSRNLIFSSTLPDRGMVTYHIVLNPINHDEIEAGYLYVGSQQSMELVQVFQRAQFYRCNA